MVAECLAVVSLEANVDRKYLTSSDYVRAEATCQKKLMADWKKCPVHHPPHGADKPETGADEFPPGFVWSEEEGRPVYRPSVDHHPDCDAMHGVGWCTCRGLPISVDRLNEKEPPPPGAERQK